MYSFDALKCFKTGLTDFKNIFRSHKTLNNATQTKCTLITNKTIHTFNYYRLVCTFQPQTRIHQDDLISQLQI
jgi:hypothetical protein